MVSIDTLFTCNSQQQIMAQPIPEPWRKRVITALETGDDKVIAWTPQAFQRWKSETNCAWSYEAHDAIIAALSSPDITGNDTSPQEGQRAVYEFLFSYHPQNGGSPRTMYGKIALKSDGVRILILSAHTAERSSL
jgi:hypothetical protein